MKTDLEIIFIYRSNEGNETTFNSIVTGEEVMEMEDYEAENFWQIMGGLKITLDGYKTIFNSTSFYNLVKAVSFILNSIYKIRNVNCDWFDDDDSEPNQISVRITQYTVLKLKLLANNLVSLSYFHLEKETINIRNDHYFVDEVINIDSWVKQSELALFEYFKVLSNVILESADSNTVRIMKDFLIIYENICSKPT